MKPRQSRGPAGAAASWIWLAKPPARRDCYAAFRRTVRLDGKQRGAVLRVSADSDFVAWVNGREAGRGQFSDFAAEKTFSTFACGRLLQRGDNVVAIAVFHRGADFSDHEAGHPGLFAALEDESGLLLGTGPQWRGTAHPGYRQGRAERMTPQCGFTFEYDARRGADWTVPAFSDRRWPRAEVVQVGPTGRIWRSLTPRPIPHSVTGERRPVRIVQQGSLLGRRHRASPALTMHACGLRAERPDESFAAASPSAPERIVLRAPARGTGGRYFIADLGTETVGLPEFEVTADRGTVIEVAHGEHLDDGRVRMVVGPRRFADRYICRGGRQFFQMPFRRLGARYLEVHVSCYRRCVFHGLGLREVNYPTTVQGAFHAPDKLTNLAHGAAVRTLALCRHEHYEDSPWREQSLYAYDARLQALYGYYAFGDYEFPAVSLALLGRNARSDGWLRLTAPGRVPLCIPVFSFVWIAAIEEHWLHSGSTALFDAHRSVIDGVVEAALARGDETCGLYRPPDEPGMWHFYEWTEGLHGTPARRPLHGAHHAAYNLHLHEALTSAARMFRHGGETQRSVQLTRKARVLARAIHQAFWDPQAGIYRTTRGSGTTPEGAHELVQALALATGVVPHALRSRVFRSLKDGKLVPSSLATDQYLARGVRDLSPASRAWLHNRLHDSWTKMLRQGATTLWETNVGAEDFDGAGSLCHGWSALPAHYHPTHVLGVEPLAPGFQAFQLRINPTGHQHAEGSIPTPRGPIEVRWNRQTSGLDVEVAAPPPCRAHFAAFPEAPVRRLSFNGRIMRPPEV